ncbi:MAG: vgr related protein, partial [Sphingomonas bacterium]|nr:vgr related protein [Sphingomonas bacterium]
WRLERYGLEQQAEIVRHAYLLREGYPVPGAAGPAQYESILSTFR